MKLMKENMICLISLIANIEDKGEVDEREYDPASILQPCLMKMQVTIMMKMLIMLRKGMTLMIENMI